MQLLLAKLGWENVELRKLVATRNSILLTLDSITDILLIINQFRINWIYIWLLIAIHIHTGIEQCLTIIKHCKIQNISTLCSYLLSVSAFFGLSEISILRYSLWSNINKKKEYLEWQELCWIHSAMRTIPSLALQIFDLIAFSNTSLATNYSYYKFFSIVFGLLSIANSIVSIEKFVNEYPDKMLKAIHDVKDAKIKSVEKERSKLEEQLEKDWPKEALLSKEEQIEIKMNLEMNIIHDDINIQEKRFADDGVTLEQDIKAVDTDIEIEEDSVSEGSFAAMVYDSYDDYSQSEKDSDVQSQYWMLSQPALNVVQYSQRYYYAYTALLMSDFIIRTLTISYLQYIIFSDVLSSYTIYSPLYLSIVIYVFLFRLTFIRYDININFNFNMNNFFYHLLQFLFLLYSNFLPSGYMIFKEFHRLMFPKILLCLNTCVLFLSFTVYLYLFNLHHLILDADYRVVSYNMSNVDEDVILILSQVVLGIAWVVYFISLPIFYYQGNVQLMRQLESLIPSYANEGLSN